MADERILNFALTVDEANLILKYVGGAPYAEVSALIAKMQEQGKQQIEPAPEAIPVP